MSPMLFQHLLFSVSHCLCNFLLRLETFWKASLDNALRLCVVSHQQNCILPKKAAESISCNMKRFCWRYREQCPRKLLLFFFFFQKLKKKSKIRKRKGKRKCSSSCWHDGVLFGLSHEVCVIQCTTAVLAQEGCIQPCFRRLPLALLGVLPCVVCGCSVHTTVCSSPAHSPFLDNLSLGQHTDLPAINSCSRTAISSQISTKALRNGPYAFLSL